MFPEGIHVVDKYAARQDGGSRLDNLVSLKEHSYYPVSKINEKDIAER